MLLPIPLPAFVPTKLVHLYFCIEVGYRRNIASDAFRVVEDEEVVTIERSGYLCVDELI